MNEKINKKHIVIGILIVLCIIFSKNIRYFFIGDKDVRVSSPTAFHLKNIGDEYGDIYYIDNSESIVYVTVDKKYLNNDDTNIYVTGSYWNSPETPLVKVNGKTIDDVTKGNSGKTGWVFSDIYFSKKYHFYMNETLEEGKEYKFYVRVKDTSDVVSVIFTSEEIE